MCLVSHNPSRCKLGNVLLFTPLIKLFEASQPWQTVAVWFLGWFQIPLQRLDHKIEKSFYRVGPYSLQRYGHSQRSYCGGVYL